MGPFAIAIIHAEVVLCRGISLMGGRAISAAGALSHSLTRITEAELRTEHGYRTSVEAQRTRDAIGVPRLSPAAAAVLEAVLTARTAAPGDIWSREAERDRPDVARAWEAGRRDPAVAAEIDRFQGAVERRLGEDGIRAALRRARDGSALSVPRRRTRATQGAEPTGAQSCGGAIRSR